MCSNVIHLTVRDKMVRFTMVFWGSTSSILVNSFFSMYVLFCVSCFLSFLNKTHMLIV